MTTEQLHDALNLLDDSLISKVDTLRQQGRPKPSHPPRWGLLAACLCVILVGTFALRSLTFGSGKDGASSTGMSNPPTTGASGGSADPNVSAGNASSSPGDSPISSPGYGTGTPITDNVPTDSTISASNSLIIRVDSWQTDGFHGTIVSEEGDTIFRPGHEILVLFSEDAEIIDQDGSLLPYGKQQLSGENYVPTGSLLFVKFTSFDFNESTQSYDCIYASYVMPKDLYDRQK